MPELVVEDLRASVAGREILSGVDLVVPSGEVHALMGPNGSGKSTLAHVLLGRPGYEVLGGRATLDGVDLLSLPTWERVRAGLFLIPQYPVEVPGVSLLAALSEALTASGRAVGDLVTVLATEAARIGLDSRILDRALNVDLSGGERKRNEALQLAALRPPIAVLDEIDSGLDVDGLRAVARRIVAAKDEWGLGVLAITHYRRLLIELPPDRVHVFVRGRVVEEGGPELAVELERTGYGAWGLEAEPEPAEPAGAAFGQFLPTARAD